MEWEGLSISLMSGVGMLLTAPWPSEGVSLDAWARPASTAEEVARVGFTSGVRSDCVGDGVVDCCCDIGCDIGCDGGCDGGCPSFFTSR